MQIKNTLWVAPLIIIMTIIFFAGCSELELSGTAPANQPPDVYFVNVPNDSSSYSYNPTVYWYGNDVDGRITEYYYKVILKDSLPGGPTAYADSVGNPDSSWIVVEATSDTTFLYASLDPSIYWQQYIFIRARDDNDAYSTVKYKIFARNNHEPDTHLQTNFWRTYYSYPFVTEYFAGLMVEWEGSDSLDFPDEQPDFQYRWALYGPFESASDTNSTDVFTSYDSLGDSTITWSSYNPATGTVWVPNVSVRLFNLSSGYYLFRVRALDDAFVMDPADTNSAGDVASIGIFHAMQPYWSSDHDSLMDIMVIDDSRYSPFPGENNNSDSFREFYMNVLSDAGIDTVNMVTWVTNDPNNIVDPDELVKHKMLLIIDDDWFTSLGDSAVVWYSRYLDVGGKIMINGRYSLRAGARGESVPYVVYYGSNVGDISGQNPQGTFASTYLDLYGSWFPGWHFLNNLSQEMVGAYAYHSSFSDVSLDTVKVKEVVYSFYDTLEVYLPAVEYLMRNNNSETIFKFKSYQPELSDWDNFPAAVRYSPEAEFTYYYSRSNYFHTSYFSFPLYYLKYSDAVDVMEAMLEWYGVIE